MKENLRNENIEKYRIHLLTEEIKKKLETNLDETTK